MTRRTCGWVCGCFLLASVTTQVEAIDLLQRFPSQLNAGDATPGQARPWEFAASDIFRVARFEFKVGKGLRVETGPADLGIGHCGDGAVWAVIIPREGGELTSSAASRPEVVSHVWLRFHPKVIARLFPPETVSADGATNLVWQMRAIATAKMNSSWHADGSALIPEPREMTVDVDTKGGPRRFFDVDTEAVSAKYWPSFADHLACIVHRVS